MTILESRLIHIGSHDARAQVYPERGFQLLGFQVQREGTWTELIYGPQDALEPADRRYGNPVLFPCVGVCNGAFPDSWQHEGGNLPMPAHGWARNVYWQVEAVTGTSITAALIPHPGFKLGFPFPFEMRLTYSVQDRALILDASIENVGDRPFPYALGFHPYLRAPVATVNTKPCVIDLPAGTRLGTEDGWRNMNTAPAPARSILQTDAELPGSILLRETGATTMRVRDEAAGVATCVSVAHSEQSFPVWVAWTASASAPYVCLEPWTDAPNALNRAGTRTLAPGLSHRYRMAICLETL